MIVEFVVVVVVVVEEDVNGNWVENKRLGYLNLFSTLGQKRETATVKLCLYEGINI